MTRKKPLLDVDAQKRAAAKKRLVQAQEDARLAADPLLLIEGDREAYRKAHQAGVTIPQIARVLREELGMRIGLKKLRDWLEDDRKSGTKAPAPTPAPTPAPPKSENNTENARERPLDSRG